MKKQTRVLVITVAAVVLLLGGAQYILRNQASLGGLPNLSVRNVFKPQETVATPTEAPRTETVNIEFGNGKKLTGEVSTQSAYQALVAVAKDNGMTVETKQYKYGVLVTKVGDRTNTNNSSWMYWVNGKQGQIASDRYVIHPGDRIEWKFTKL